MNFLKSLFNYAWLYLGSLVVILLGFLKLKSNKIERLERELSNKSFEAEQNIEIGKNIQDAKNLNEKIKEFNEGDLNEGDSNTDSDGYVTTVY